MKTYVDGLDHNQDNETVMGSFKKVQEATQKLQNLLDAEDYDTPEEREEHDCGLDEGGEGSCDNPIHKNYE